jgi:tripartite-type tricarboxylate transporter receptor subunit TctC
MKLIATRWLISASFLFVLGGAAQFALAQDSFFKGKTINLVVGYSAGGGYDQYGRLLARHLGRHVPGNPTVIVQNMPGAASLTSVRYLELSAPKDGTALALFDPGLILESIAAPDTVKVSFGNYQWVGALLRDVRICYASAASGVRTWNDMMNRREFLIGTTAKGSNAYVNGAILRKVFRAPLRQIAGYPGSNEQRLALERGELEGNCASWSAIPQDWIVNSRINVLVRFSPKRPPDMPESVPYVVDLAMTAEERDLLLVLNGPSEVGRPLIVAKEVPRDRVATLRAALKETLQDERFLSEAQKQNLPLDPVSGAEAEQIIKSIYASPPEFAGKVKAVLE